MGPRIDEIYQAARDGLDATLDKLLSQAPIPPPPVKHRKDDDPKVKYGETWVNTPYGGRIRFRGQSLNSWYARGLVDENSRLNLQSRMVFFWCDYFGMSGLQTDHRTMYKQLRLFQEEGTGNYRTMIERITVEPRMLDFLDGKVNRKTNPNENYGRELMELFTIGKGKLAGPGDYTNYTEQDVAALSRSLTGWNNRDYLYSSKNVPVESYFDSSDHDTGDKQLSHRFDNRVIRNAGANEYKVVIGILFEQRETARNFCRKLYRYFIYHEITEQIEREFIDALATTLIDNDFEIKPVLRHLLSSDHFYDPALRGGMIKNPQEYLCSILRPFREYEHDKRLKDIRLSYDLGDRYAIMLSKLNMKVLEAPTVSGWKAYYDAPQYYRHWISPSLMQYRYEMVNAFVQRGFHINNVIMDFDWYAFIDSLPGKYDINELIDDVLLLFLPRELKKDQRQFLKDQIMEGAIDEDWIFEIKAYLAHPGDRSYYFPIEQRLRKFFSSLFSLAEFQLQ
jgi:hypothetical protein